MPFKKIQQTDKLAFVYHGEKLSVVTRYLEGIHQNNTVPTSIETSSQLIPAFKCFCTQT